MQPRDNVVDAAVRFLRSNPYLLAYAQREAGVLGLSVDALLADTACRIRHERDGSGLESIAQEQLLIASAASGHELPAPTGLRQAYGESAAPSPVW